MRHLRTGLFLRNPRKTERGAKQFLRHVAVRAVPFALLCGSFGRAAEPVAEPANPAKIPTCFKVRRLLKTDEAHYWADWKNTCPFTIDQVYVMVSFQDRSRKTLGSGVWPMYFILPGAHRVTRFSVPVGVDGFRFVTVRRIIPDAAEALR